MMTKKLKIEIKIPKLPDLQLASLVHAADIVFPIEYFRIFMHYSWSISLGNG
jgi:hypothetical protein